MYDELNEQELSEHFIRELTERTMEGEQLHMTVDVHITMLIFAAVQLALRHPKYPPGTRRILLQWMRRVEAQLSRTPAMAECIRRGWLQEYDEPDHARTN